jgi:hypothetical protein
MDTRQDEINTLLAQMQEAEDFSKGGDLIKDNKIEFTYEDKSYRLRLMNRKEKEELDSLRRRRFGQLIKDKDILLESDLKKQYKERGIDLEDAMERVRELYKEKSSYDLKLGEALANKEEETILKSYKENIIKINYEISAIISQQTNLLSYSLENQLASYVTKIAVYLSLEVQDDDKWIRQFKTLESFENFEDEKLLEKATYYCLLLNS